MIGINKGEILLVLGLTLCSALIAESWFDFERKSSQEIFESWLIKQNANSNEAYLAKALEYAAPEKIRSNSFYKETVGLIMSWKHLAEVKDSKNCSDSILKSVDYVEESLEGFKPNGIVSRILNPLLKEIKANCKGFVRKFPKVDLVRKASDLLYEKTKSFDIGEYIKVAEKILARNENDELEPILEDLVALKTIAEQNRDGTLVCSDENMDLIKKIHDTIEKYTLRFGLVEGNYLINIIKTITEQVGKVCLKPVADRFAALEPKLDYDRVRALKQFSNVVDHESLKPMALVERARLERPINLSRKAALDWADRFVRMNVALFGEEKLCEWDPLERRNHITSEFMREKFNDVVVNTCRYFLEERKDLTPIVEETLKIARKVMLYTNTLPVVFVKNGLADVASNYVVCKRLENVDQTQLIENIAEYLPKAEEDFGKRRMFDFDRTFIESGC